MKVEGINNFETSKRQEGLHVKVKVTFNLDERNRSY